MEGIFEKHKQISKSRTANSALAIWRSDEYTLSFLFANQSRFWIFGVSFFIGRGAYYRSRNFQSVRFIFETAFTIF